MKNGNVIGSYSFTNDLMKQCKLTPLQMFKKETEINGVENKIGWYAYKYDKTTKIHTYLWMMHGYINERRKDILIAERRGFKLATNYLNL